MNLTRLKLKAANYLLVAGFAIFTLLQLLAVLGAGQYDGPLRGISDWVFGRQPLLLILLFALFGVLLWVQRQQKRNQRPIQITEGEDNQSSD